MKNMLFIAVIIFNALRVSASQETLIHGNIESGGFGGPVFKMGNVYHEAALLIGGRGGWIINHQYMLGAGGYALVNEIPSKQWANYNMDLGYGGIELAYIQNPDKLTHLSFMILLGGGSVGFTEQGRDQWDESQDFDTFYIAEPGVNLILNVTQFFRLGLGGSYRFVKGVQGDSELVSKNLSGPTLVITLKFGTF
jgi:hypothetical protein